MKLFITLNDNVIYSKNFTQFSDLSGTYYTTTTTINSTSRNFLDLPSMNSNTVNSIWVTVDTGLVDYIVSNYKHTHTHTLQYFNDFVRIRVPTRTPAADALFFVKLL